MNAFMILSLICITTGCMLVVIDQHYYHRTTIVLLEKKIQSDYEAEAGNGILYL